MKISKSFFSVLLLTSTVVFTGGKNCKYNSTELTTYYDSTTDDDKKLTIWNLDDQYTSHVLRKIVYDTFDTGKLPSHAMDTFDQLLRFQPNFIFLPQVLNQKILNISRIFDPIDQTKIKSLILTSVQIACINNNQQYYQNELNKEIKKLTELLQQLKKLENNNSNE